MTLRDALVCQRALARVPDVERAVLAVLYVPRRMPVDQQFRLLRLPQAHAAAPPVGLRMFDNLRRLVYSRPNDAVSGKGSGKPPKAGLGRLTRSKPEPRPAQARRVSAGWRLRGQSSRIRAAHTGRQVTRTRLAPAGGGQTPAARDVVTSWWRVSPCRYSDGRGQHMGRLQTLKPRVPAGALALWRRVPAASPTRTGQPARAWLWHSMGQAQAGHPGQGLRPAMCSARPRDGGNIVDHKVPKAQGGTDNEAEPADDLRAVPPGQDAAEAWPRSSSAWLTPTIGRLAAAPSARR